MSWQRNPLIWTGVALFLGLMTIIGSRMAEIGAPWRSLAAAQSRWLAADLGHYRLEVVMKGWGGCTQVAEVVQEQVTVIDRNSCRYHNPRTVTSLFREIERFAAPPDIGIACRTPLPGRDCACYAPYIVATRYHPQLGYPEQVIISIERYAPNRAHLHYWRYLITHGREPSCGGPLEPAGRHIEVVGLEPLP